MKLEAQQLRLSATDLANHLACRHKTTLERGVAEGLWKPPDWYRPEAEVLRQRGFEHERAYLAYLESQGRKITRLEPDEEGESALERTLAAMRSGAEVIAQATLAHGRWLGRADVLIRVERGSRLGAWSYEALDTKLARETKAGAILQLCLYSELLEAMQGALPEHMFVVPRRPEFPLEKYRVAEYLAYHRFVKHRLEKAVDADAGSAAPATYPEPVPHCDVCRWWPRCDRQRRADDHLSFVAGLSRLQGRELESHDIETLAALASQPVPLPWRPARGAKEGYVRVREQARVQLAGRTESRRVREMLPPEPGRGLALLPEPSPGDLFVDLEGDPYVDDGGLEYLFGWAAAAIPHDGTLALEVGSPRYHHRWALKRGAERRGFEALMDAIIERLEREPNLHVYHYGAYEPAAVKRLMGRHGTRESEVDRLLRGGRFVDLHAIVKQSMRASVEEYSIKQMEAFYGFAREQPLEEAGSALRTMERGLELGADLSEEDGSARVVEAYNRDDCFSALALRDWLERLRAETIAGGAQIERPKDESGDASEAVGDRERRARDLADRLLAGVPYEREDRTDEQHARWLLAHMLEWHRREEKAPWWEYFRLRGMSHDDLLDEMSALSGLEHLESLPAQRSRVDRYRFAPQETRIREGDKLHLPLPDGRALGEVVAIDLGARTVDIKSFGPVAGLHPVSAFAHDTVPARAQEESLVRLAAWVAAHGMDAPGSHRAARDLLIGLRPRLAGHEGGALERPGEGGVDAARRLVLQLDHGALAIQGPPGSGKTFTGARMICDLVRAGRQVGVCAQSHKVITNLLKEVVAATEPGMKIPCLQKVRKKGDVSFGGIAEAVRNEDARDALRSRRARVVGGTSWMWAREEFSEAVDVLFVDEAGQMSLANVLAIAQSAKNLVLLGDPQQLEQPIQGTHPEGTAVSALEHVLRGDETIADDRGLFLAETWRLPPEICQYTSELFYENRLRAHSAPGRQVILDAGRVDGAGLWFVPVMHDANQSASPEEVDVVAEWIGALLTGARWRDRDGVERPLGIADILVIAPYNAQVADLEARLPKGARVGTVDRFQGQEAPVVIYSMTTSTPEDAPHGMEFLYNPNRFNVATSRARCTCIVVGSPRLFEPDCQSPRQIKLANAFCRFLEVAREVPQPAPAEPRS